MSPTTSSTSRHFSGVVPAKPVEAAAWNLYHGQVDLIRLDPARRRQAWDFIKANRPELRQMLEADPVFDAIRERFQVRAIWIPVEDAGLDSAGAP